MKTLKVKSRAGWSRWLRTHHAREREVWLVLYKVGSPRRTFVYAEALDEALCWGWIDSRSKGLDEGRYTVRFTPRANPDHWSPTNVRRMRELLADGAVQPSGLAVVAPAVLRQMRAGKPVARRAAPRMPAELRTLLAEDGKAQAYFETLPPSARGAFLAWVGQAKQAETRQRRAKEAVGLLARGRRLGLK